ncbi:MAG TPA: right-handed parallel beta-helix repeat-containing protein, partial [Terriglobales bacterium]
MTLYLESGATILAAPTPLEGTTNGYDPVEPQGAWEPYQDYGHNHWHNSLIWGESIHDVAIMGPGLIWGKGLSRGLGRDKDLPLSGNPGVGNKAIALKNCYNVTLRDFSILQGGWFGILATGVDNFTIDNLKIDTNRDGIDIDCCKNVRVSNCRLIPLGTMASAPKVHSHLATRGPR